MSDDARPFVVRLGLAAADLVAVAYVGTTSVVLTVDSGAFERALLWRNALQVRGHLTVDYIFLHGPCQNRRLSIRPLTRGEK